MATPIITGSMKYFWPINEAIYACALAWFKTRDSGWLEWLDRVDRFACDTFVDREYGGWFGYLDRRGHLALDSKGGNYMSFFHVPRSLMMTAQLIEQNQDGAAKRGIGRARERKTNPSIILE